MAALRLTPARKRALMKARSSGFVMRSGGFGAGDYMADVIKHAGFDRSPIIDWLLTHDLLRFGSGFNQYVITQRGLSLLGKSSQRGRRKAALTLQAEA